ncbi:MAG: SDR family oxidoreductase [Pirellulaceae bacterium]|nr:SDR family oxidoreductase [Pirellulaceae bacterium]
MFDLGGRTALVAGGAGYLGSAICRGLLHHGANVIVADLDQARADHFTETWNRPLSGQRCSALPLDISDESSIGRLIDRVCSDCRGLDILINATYAPQKCSLNDMTGGDFNTSLNGNLTGGFLLAREGRRAMSNGGSIVMFSSMYGRVSPDPSVYVDPMQPNPIEYGVAKAGIEQMIRYLAVAWAAEGIRINGVAPGPFPNPQVQQQYPDFVARLARKVPLGRIGQANEIVGAVVFLVSDAASYVTGQCLAIDGGWTIW